LKTDAFWNSLVTVAQYDGHRSGSQVFDFGKKIAEFPLFQGNSAISNKIRKFPPLSHGRFGFFLRQKIDKAPDRPNYP